MKKRTDTILLFRFRNFPIQQYLRYWNRCILYFVSIGILFVSPAWTDQKDTPRFFAYFVSYNKDLDYLANRYDLLIWHNHPDLVKSLPFLRERNPHITSILYRELFCVLREETPLQESVGHYNWIMANHPQWFQKDTQGHFVEIPDYPGRFMMDFGNPQWQEFWINQTLKDVKEGQWDGVFIDDVLTSIKMHRLPALMNYPDDKSLQEAVGGFLKKIYTVFNAENKLVLANISNLDDYPGLFKQWLQITDGIMEEHFAGESWSWGAHVGQAQLQNLQIARMANKWYLAMTYGASNNSKLKDLSLATYLIGSGGKVAWSYRPYNEYPEPLPVDPDWLLTIGKPLEESKRQGAVWYRKFERATLFVNPTMDELTIEYLGKKYIISPQSFKKI